MTPDEVLSKYFSTQLPKWAGGSASTVGWEMARSDVMGEIPALLRQNLFPQAGALVYVDLETRGLNKPIFDISLREIGRDFQYTQRSFRSRIRADMGAKGDWEPTALEMASQKYNPKVLARAREPAQVRKNLLGYLKNLKTETGGKLRLVGHNISAFDIPKLKEFIGESAFGELFDDVAIDTLVVAQYLKKTRPDLEWANVKLETLSQAFGMGPQRAHVAPTDTRVGTRVTQHLYDLLGTRAQPMTTKSALGSSLQMHPHLKGPRPMRAKVPESSFPREIQGLSEGMARAFSGLTKYKRAAGMAVAGLGAAAMGIWAFKESTKGSRMNFRGPDFMTQMNLPGAPWIQPSAMGFQTREEVWNRYNRFAEDEDTVATSAGTFTHQVVERAVRSVNEVESIEHFAVDPRNRTYGYIDVLLKGGIPLEIKSSATGRDVSRLNAPKPEHVSQANAYAMMMQAPYGYILYASREPSNVTKLFKIPADPGLYARDIARTRQFISESPYDLTPVNTLSRNLDNYFGYVTDKVLHPWRAIGATPTNEIVGAPAINDWGRRIAEGFRAPQGGVVQALFDNALKSKYRSQHCRLGMGRVHCSTSPVQSRSERTTVSV